MSDDKIKHLEFIQNVIIRMNTNSFQIKSWFISIVSAFLAIFASTKESYFLLAAVFPCLIFWFLDAYYLSQERKFRGLYNDVAGLSDADNIKTFSMKTDLYNKDTNKKYSFWNAFLSTTIYKIYLSVLTLLIVSFIYYKCK